jgi:hypothetical protein
VSHHKRINPEPNKKIVILTLSLPKGKDLLFAVRDRARAHRTSAFMQVNQRFAQPNPNCNRIEAVVPLKETPKNPMDRIDFAVASGPLHNFRVTPLCMSCTRLMNKNLQTHEFR